MSNSNPLPPFTFDLLCYLNPDQLEQFSIVCRPLKNIIDRYFSSKPSRIFDRLEIHGGSYGLRHNSGGLFSPLENHVHWHPNREDYSVQQFLAGQKCSIDIPWNSYTYHSFAEMRPYLGSNVRIKWTETFVGGENTYNPDRIEQMESIAHLWGDADIRICSANVTDRQIVAEHFQLILNSPSILKCQNLKMSNANFSFKDYKVLYSVKVFEIDYRIGEVDTNYWFQFIEQPGAKPVVVLGLLHRESIDNVLKQLFKAFSSALSPTEFKIAFIQCKEPVSEFRETNNTSGEILELKKGLPVECQVENLVQYYKNTSKYQHFDCHTLERSSI